MKLLVKVNQFTSHLSTKQTSRPILPDACFCFFLPERSWLGDAASFDWAENINDNRHSARSSIQIQNNTLQKNKNAPLQDYCALKFIQCVFFVVSAVRKTGVVGKYP